MRETDHIVNSPGMYGLSLRRICSSSHDVKLLGPALTEIDFLTGSSFENGRSTIELNCSYSGNLSDMQRGAEGCPPQYVSSNSLNPEGNRMDGIAIGAAKMTDYMSEASRVEGRSPKTLQEALAQGTTSITQYVNHTLAPSIDTIGTNKSNEQGFHESMIFADGLVSPDSSPFLEQEGLLHSTSERKYMENIYDRDG
jgi:hypothetical protein